MAHDRASLAQTWLRLDIDLERMELEPFHAGLTSGERAGHTAFVLLVSAALFVFLNEYSAGLVLALGLVAIWNRGNRITRLEKKLFWTGLDLAVLFGLIEKFGLFDAAGLLLISVLVHLVWLWRR